MVMPILVATSTPGYGDMIRQLLEETGRFTATLVDNAGEVLHRVSSSPYSLCILDSELQDSALPDLAHALKAMQPELRLVIITPDEALKDLMGLSLPANGWLARDFYPYGLLDTLDEVLRNQPPINDQSPKLEDQAPARSQFPTQIQRPAALSSSPRLEWLQDVSRAAQHLTSLTLESSAQAALIVRKGKLWFNAGGLSQHSAMELAELVAENWPVEKIAGSPGGRKGDLARFVQLDEEGEFLIYATYLGEEMVLVLAFDARTPFSQIRTQAGLLARALSSPPSAVGFSDATFPHPVKDAPGDRAEDTGEASPSPSHPVMPILGDVPPSHPKPLATEREEELGLSWLPEFTTGTVEPNLPSKAGYAREFGDKMAELPTPDGPTQPSPSLKANSILDTLEEIRPHLRKMAPVESDFQPSSPAQCLLAFACLLIPRFPSHPLVGDLAERLPGCVSQATLAFAWRLEHISIRPEYLLWVVAVPPNTSPSYLVQLIRQHTSQYIFAEFPALARDNPSGDFWAPGYLIMSGSQPPPASVVKEYINQTRRYQGVGGP